MAIPRTKARLHVNCDLASNRMVELDSERTHYVTNVKRMSPGDFVGLFNGFDGEWVAKLASGSRQRAKFQCISRTREQEDAPDVWLLFAPLKKARTDFAVEKATELGVSAIVPVRTEYTNARRVQSQRLQLVAREAAEQCDGLSVPNVRELTDLAAILSEWPLDRTLLFCDEASRAGTVLDPAQVGTDRLAVLIGPEGGFSERERNHLSRLENAVRVGLGPRLLRAETAVAAALSLLNIRGFRR